MPLQVADGSAARFKVGQGLFVRLGLRRHLLPPLQTPLTRPMTSSYKFDSIDSMCSLVWKSR